MRFEELISQVAEETNLTRKEVRSAIKTFFNILSREFEKAKEGEKLRIQGYGTFKVVRRAPKRGRNPKTGELVEVPARKVLVFKPSQAFVKELEE